MKALNLLYKCNDNGLYLYVSDGKLKYKQIKIIDEATKHKLLELIKQYKDKLISILSYNDIVDFNQVDYPIIYRLISVTTPLSFAQERLWFIENYEAGSNAYNIPFIKKLSSHVQIKLLEKALQAVVSRHEILHSLIKTDNIGNGYQEVIDLNALPLVIKHHSFATSALLNDFVSTEVNHVFRLDIEYPIRITFLKQSNTTEKYLLIVVHHIAFDGWSSDILIRDLRSYYDFYEALETNQPNKLTITELKIQYKDFSVWQKIYLSGDRLANQLNYWKNKLSGYAGLNLPIDKTRPIEISYVGDNVYFSLNLEISAQLRKLQRSKESVYIVFYLRDLIYY